MKLCPRLTLLNRYEHDFCRSEIKMVADGKSFDAVIFGSKPQLLLLIQVDLIAVDGFFKLKVLRFKQLVTFAVFLSSVYIPVVHILLTDKTTVSYEQAFRQFKFIADCDTENQIEWEKKQLITDFELARQGN